METVSEEWSKNKVIGTEVRVDWDFGGDVTSVGARVVGLKRSLLNGTALAVVRHDISTTRMTPEGGRYFVPMGEFVLPIDDEPQRGHGFGPRLDDESRSTLRSALGLS